MLKVRPELQIELNIVFVGNVDANINFNYEGSYEVQDDGRACCLICGKMLSNVINAKRHYRLMHMMDPSQRNFKCDLCQATFPVKEYLNNHKRSTHRIYKRS